MLLSGPKSSFQMKVNFAFHLEPAHKSLYKSQSGEDCASRPRFLPEITIYEAYNVLETFKRHYTSVQWVVQYDIIIGPIQTGQWTVRPPYPAVQTKTLLKCFTLHVMNLKYMKVSVFEISF